MSLFPSVLREVHATSRLNSLNLASVAFTVTMYLPTEPTHHTAGWIFNSTVSIVEEFEFHVCVGDVVATQFRNVFYCLSETGIHV
jgi:hypothetical protein